MTLYTYIHTFAHTQVGVDGATLGGVTLSYDPAAGPTNFLVGTEQVIYASDYMCVCVCVLCMGINMCMCVCMYVYVFIRAHMHCWCKFQLELEAISTM